MVNGFVCDHQTKVDVFLPWLSLFRTPPARASHRAKLGTKLIWEVIGAEDDMALSCSDHLSTGFTVEKTKLDRQRR